MTLSYQFLTSFSTKRFNVIVTVCKEMLPYKGGSKMIHMHDLGTSLTLSYQFLTSFSTKRFDVNVTVCKEMLPYKGGSKMIHMHDLRTSCDIIISVFDIFFHQTFQRHCHSLQGNVALQGWEQDDTHA